MPDLGQNCEQEAEVFPFQTEIAQVRHWFGPFSATELE